MTTTAVTETDNSLSLWRSTTAGCVVTRLAIVGDFLPTGNVPTTEGASWRDLVRPLSPHFDDVAITFANLECSIEPGGLPRRTLNGIGEIVSAPAGVLEYLDALNCRAAGLANNHSHDFGAQGATRTREALLRKGITPLGAGRMLKDLPEVFVWQGPGSLRIGFWAAAKAAHDLATHKSAGVEPATLARAKEALAAMRRQNAMFCIALLHAGSLRTNRPSPEDVQLLRAVSRCGYQIVAASHSHRAAGFEKVTTPGQPDSYCFYGLGSILSGYVASPLEREGLVVVAGFDSEGAFAAISVRPIYIAANGCGKVPAPDMSRTILSRFALLSEEISNGSYKRLFYKEISNGLVRLYVRDARAAFRQSGVQGLTRKVSRLRLRHMKRLLHGVLTA